jgi:UDP-glucose 4-epimerase
MTNILITGANGLVGNELLKRFKDTGDNIIATDINSAPSKNINRLDITERNNVEFYVRELAKRGEGTIIHLAALVAGPPSVKNPYGYLHTNVDGTLNILEAMRTYGVKKLITMSSWSTFGADIDLPITEETEQKPVNPYGVSKTMIDQMYKLYSDLYGLEIIVLRPTMLYGPGQVEYNLVQEIADHMVTGKTFEIWGKGEHTRELLHVYDMAFVIDRCLTYTPDNGYEIFVVGTEKPLSVIDVCKAGQKAKSFSIKFVPSNKWVFDQRSDCSKMREKLHISTELFLDIDYGLKESYEYKLGEQK